MPNHKIAIGIDVGGRRKGFHVVALSNGEYYDKLSCCDEREVSKWCKKIGGSVIAIDAPSRWRNEFGMRLCERQLRKKGISCFATPSRENAEDHPTNYYGWMLRGECLYEALDATHPRIKSTKCSNQRCCIETFPHAVTWHLRGGKNVDAKRKRSQRRKLLRKNMNNIEQLTNIDLVDAALCALTAHWFALGKCYSYGEQETGWIVVPK